MRLQLQRVWRRRCLDSWMVLHLLGPLELLFQQEAIDAQQIANHTERQAEEGSHGHDGTENERLNVALGLAATGQPQNQKTGQTG
jgi:hypothetical protein